MEWPWTKQLLRPVADPIQLEDDDARPSIPQLIEKHRDAIDQVKEKLKTHPLFHFPKHDDLWILRFVLSHQKNVTKSAAAAQATLQYRHDRKLDLEDRRYWPIDYTKVDMPYNSYVQDGFAQHAVPEPHKGVFAIVKFSLCDMPGMVQHLSNEECLQAFVYTQEWIFQWLDFVSRKTGRLTKLFRVIDLEGMTLPQFHLKHFQRESQLLGTMEDYYPQLLHGLCVVNAGPWIQIPWNLLRPLMPKRVLTKVDFAQPKEKSKDREKLLRFIDRTYLPVDYGGECSKSLNSLELPTYQE